MPPRRWLWPCADSHVLRLPAYQNPTLHACLVHPDNPDDILVSDSDDDLDDDFHTAKRQRIEAIAHSFLNGRPIYIPSATLKGPFPADRDLSLCHEPFSSPPVNPVSPPPIVTADTFIRRRPARTRPKSPTPEPTFTPSKPQQSSPLILEKPANRPQSSRQPPRSSKNKSLRFDLPSSAVSAPSTVLPPLPKFVAINKVLQTRDTPDKPPSSTAPSHTTPWFADRIPDSSFISPSPSPSKDALPALSSSKLASVLRQRPASSLNKAEKAPSSTHKLHKLSSVKKNKKPIKRVYQAAATSDTTSPFIYRRNATLARKTVVPEKDKSVECEDVVNNPSASEKQSKTQASPVKRHAVLFESSLVVPEPKLSHPPSAVAEPERSPERPQHDFVPAINMSFGQESLGMDFNIINHFNDRLPGSSANKERTDLGEGTPENQDLPVVTSAPLPVLGFYEVVSTDPGLSEASTQAKKLYADFEIETKTHEGLCELVDAVAKRNEDLEPEDERLLERYRRDYLRNGLGISLDERNRFKDIQKQLFQLTSDFEKNLREENASLWFTLEELAGVSADLISSLDKGTGKNEGKALLTFSFPHLFGVLKYTTNSETRRTYYTASETKCPANIPTFKEITQDEVTGESSNDSDAEA
ncbi:hypothetical protein D6C83_03344, partial [Aureobasidium pullulans]